MSDLKTVFLEYTSLVAQRKALLNKSWVLSTPEERRDLDKRITDARQRVYVELNRVARRT